MLFRGRPMSLYRSTADSQHSVVVVDLSMIALDVLEDLTALLGRVIFDVMMHVKHEGECQLY